VYRGPRNNMSPHKGLAATLHHNELPIIFSVFSALVKVPNWVFSC
jgi:hypothetical protein